MNWEVIGWSALTFIVLTAVLILAYFLYSRNMMKKRREALIQMDALIKPGKPCSFNGIQAKIISAGQDTCKIEIAKDVVITVSRFMITPIV